MNKYVDKWIKQGRTDEQIEGVLNFMTGQGKKMLEDTKVEVLRQVAEQGEITINQKELIKSLKSNKGLEKGHRK